jgi:hypothetical protein
VMSRNHATRRWNHSPPKNKALQALFSPPGIRDSIQAVIGSYQQKAAPPCGDAAHFSVPD